MKTLIVYYSLEGNSQYIAEELANKLNADTLKLIPKKAYADKGFAKFFWGGKSAVMAEKPELEIYDVNLAEYERIIIGFPVWASTFTPPIRTFVLDNIDALKGKKIATFACQSGKGAEKAFEKLKETLGIQEFAATGIFFDPKSKPSDENSKKIEEFCEEIQK
ncbi:Flavodoxin [Pseudobutyrivibrio sp. YE44]|uniref:flavodoxin family protein n=1 Tax=Pseudobutyrivibrio sp. YE44 TaxID=1520802 RepID=UPI00088C2ADD|nr:flavodoxin [Pseudobutyrivibrio sp. YE44]SDB50095.1 Flavodoxin [Pseudobutyrivibrio sp. YE44]